MSKFVTETEDRSNTKEANTPKEAPKPWEDPAFQGWLAALEERIEDELGMSLNDLPDLPILDGFQAGESPAEFFAGCVAPAVDEQSPEQPADGGSTREVA